MARSFSLSYCKLAALSPEVREELRTKIASHDNKWQDCHFAMRFAVCDCGARLDLGAIWGNQEVEITAKSKLLK